MYERALSHAELKLIQSRSKENRFNAEIRLFEQKIPLKKNLRQLEKTLPGVHSVRG